MGINPIYQNLHNYYYSMGIDPADFQCRYQSICRQYAYNGNMTETKMSMVGSQYGSPYPRIVVVSLDPPSESDNVFLAPEQRTTEYIAGIHENEDFMVRRPGSHWAMTQIIVKDILSIWGYRSEKASATVCESYAGKYIDNVSAYFAHVNVAKCSMNNPGRRQSSEVVHQTCSRAYLLQELIILEPEILITQGADTNRIMGNLLVGSAINEHDLPKSVEVNLDQQKVLWLPMHHPTQQINKIRSEWYFEVYIASRVLGQNQRTFSSKDLIDFIRREFKDERPGVTTHVSAVCIANAPLNHALGYNYLWRERHAIYRTFRPGVDHPTPGRENDAFQPNLVDVPERFRYMLIGL
jgi:hypothetical protein